MAHFKKMRLVPEDDYERMKIKELRDYNPELVLKARNDMTIESVLASSMSNEEKLRIIQSIHNPKKSEPLPTQTPEPATEPAPSPAELPLPVSNFEKAFNYLPATVRTKAEKLKNFLDIESDVTVNDNNELVINDEAIPQSNMTDLLNHLYNPRKGRLPRGLDSFINVLRAAHVPNSIISNRTVLAKLRHAVPRHSMKKFSSQSGQGKKIFGYAPFPYTFPKSFHKSLKSKTKGKKSKIKVSKTSISSLGLYR